MDAYELARYDATLLALRRRLGEYAEALRNLSNGRKNAKAEAKELIDRIDREQYREPYYLIKIYTAAVNHARQNTDDTHDALVAAITEYDTRIERDRERHENRSRANKKNARTDLAS